ncbi:hypothetical protein TRICI_000261 [Trichomonascus ciferrii]|uniref:chitin synthase n=1 Tax=Trichomonascus ciferrii TaxID=44093 RepID=A0A642VDV7_9ASCO|nr:hypothetical protein TRICI_000261 [Trichomonascus ciferrii]
MNSLFETEGYLERSGSQRKPNDYQAFDEEANQPQHAEFSRKRSLIRPERSRIEPGHRQYHYTQKAAQQADRINVYPSSTGNDPQEGMIPMSEIPRERIDEETSEPSDYDARGGRNVYGLNDEVGGYHTSMDYGPQNMAGHPTSPTAPLTTNDAAAQSSATLTPGDSGEGAGGGGNNDNVGDGMKAMPAGIQKKALATPDEPTSLWHAYCKLVTFWAPAPVMKLFGMKTKERQMAWREKIGLITVILYVAAFVAFLTFGFTASVCHNTVLRTRNNEVPSNYLIINGRFYDLSKSTHPEAIGIDGGTNILYPPVNAGGMDASFLFQNVNGHCKGLLTPREGSQIPHDGDNMAYYMPCKPFAQNGTTEPNFTHPHYQGYGCHTSMDARKAYYDLKVAGEVYFKWEDIKNSSRRLIVFNGNVIDLDLTRWIQSEDVVYPAEFDWMRRNDSLRGVDVSQYFSSGREAQLIRCLNEIAKVGFIDTMEIGCLASQVVLYVSLVFIIGLVGIKFLFACYFKWFLSGRLGAFYMDRKQLEAHNQQIEDWSNDINTPGPVQKAVNPPRRTNNNQDRSSKFFRNRAPNRNTNSITMSSQIPMTSASRLAPGGSIYHQGNNSRGSLMMFNGAGESPDPPFRQRSGQPSIMSADTSYRGAGLDDNSSYYQDDYYDQPPSPANMPDYVVPQPPAGYQPFGFPLAHTMCLVTAYSESVEGLRTTLDSIATTDYPNSHKLILIICDGIIKGAGNDMSTPEIALSMMKDFYEPPEQVQAYSYVSVVSGSKRHNMAKVYSGFYKYDDNTMDPSKQQRVPMMVISKCGTPAEANAAKPGNRGKRDSQIILMSFLQKVMFDDRMTELEYEIFNGIWRITGIAPDFYEIMLMVDADTKVFPDSLTHMVATMVKDPEVMGLCGETKIANKTESWVSMIQVFEYFISHHQAKAFESVFGGVTCLPGCFCMYRIKTPKGADGYWVPILANPDIVERYADNVVDTLHKKNLLLLGEDRFLSTLMLRTFPKRKQIFVPKAACKTICPAEFMVLLSQRRRWINSTVHNLFELVLVRDLCGVFCISMQFVVFMDLVSTLVLPAAISFTLYVVIIAIVSTPTPTMSLILLALILGLPGVLIVVTASRASYILWMLIYLLALPIWNFILPMYAYWKFDDFSWGDTRAIQGGDKGHEDAEGEFDSSQIVMKRWREFERERKRAMPSSPGMWPTTASEMGGPASQSMMSTSSPSRVRSPSTTAATGNEVQSSSDGISDEYRKPEDSSNVL